LRPRLLPVVPPPSPARCSLPLARATTRASHGCRRSRLLTLPASEPTGCADCRPPAPRASPAELGGPPADSQARLCPSSAPLYREEILQLAADRTGLCVP
ncbi:unnamed protein product, partial [Ectocarpus sp. 6 AP-2014]